LLDVIIHLFVSGLITNICKLGSCNRIGGFGSGCCLVCHGKGLKDDIHPDVVGCSVEHPPPCDHPFVVSRSNECSSIYMHAACELCNGPSYDNCGVIICGLYVTNFLNISEYINTSRDRSWGNGRCIGQSNVCTFDVWMIGSIMSNWNDF